MLDRRTRSYIERELEQIRRLMSDYRELLAVPDAQEPGLIERTALSTVLQSFYNGVENIFQTIAKRIDQDLPASADWHRQLWVQMARPRATRPPVITPAMADQLEPYLGFRHIARHTYSFALEWTRMRDLVGDLASVWERFRAEIQAFLDQQEESEDSAAASSASP